MGDTPASFAQPGCAGDTPWPVEWENKLPEGLTQASHFANKTLITRAGHGPNRYTSIFNCGASRVIFPRVGAVFSAPSPGRRVPGQRSPLHRPGKGCWTFRGRQREARGQVGGDETSSPAAPTWCPAAAAISQAPDAPALGLLRRELGAGEGRQGRPNSVISPQHSVALSSRLSTHTSQQILPLSEASSVKRAHAVRMEAWLWPWPMAVTL